MRFYFLPAFWSLSVPRPLRIWKASKQLCAVLAPGTQSEIYLCTRFFLLIIFTRWPSFVAAVVFFYCFLSFHEYVGSVCCILAFTILMAAVIHFLSATARKKGPVCVGGGWYIRVGFILASRPVLFFRLVFCLAFFSCTTKCILLCSQPIVIGPMASKCWHV